MFSRLSRGERFVVVTGALLLLSLAFFPWHRSVVLLLLYGDPTRTALQSPNPLPGTLAFLVTVAMLAQVLMTRYGNQKVNPALVRLQPVAAMAVVAFLAWKLAEDTVDLSTGAFICLPLSAVLAYGAFVLAREQGSAR